jgi:hypothetical protein
MGSLCTAHACMQQQQQQQQRLLGMQLLQAE